MLSVRKKDFSLLMREIQGSSAILTLEGQGDDCDVIIQEVCRNPITDEFEHIDFLALVEDRAIHASIQIRATGESVGVKSHGGILEYAVHEIAVSCLPKNLPENISVDIAELDVGMAIHIKDLPAIEGVTYTGNVDVVVIACTEPVAEEKRKEEEEAVEDGSEEKEVVKDDSASQKPVQ